MQQTGKQLIIVGDSNQAIYEWRGAVDYMDKVPVAHRLQLTGSYRFGPEVAEEANKWLSLLASDLRIKGWKRLTSVVTDEPQDEEPDCLIYRTNGGVIGGAIRALENGKRVAIVGGGGAIRALAEAAEDLQNGRKTEHPELVGFETWADVQRYVKEEPEDAGTLVPLVRAVDEHGPAAIMSMASRLVPEDRAEVTLTTAHKAKGREWNHVRVGDDFPVPQPGREPRKEELRLAYVTVTRAKQLLERGSLAYIDGMV
jgi:superfamily I DNA/RNA helicase